MPGLLAPEGIAVSIIVGRTLQMAFFDILVDQLFQIFLNTCTARYVQLIRVDIQFKLLINIKQIIEYILMG
jgi:hypothetical protein